MNQGLPDAIVRLRDVIEADIPIFFDQQLDADANWMAAFTTKDPTDWAAFMARWTRIRSDESIVKQTILIHSQVVGHILCFEMFGQSTIGYWIGKRYWGQGIATQALTQFLGHVKTRPLYARVAQDNRASLRVLEKCGFTISGADSGFAPARGTEIEEYILMLPHSD